MFGGVTVRNIRGFLDRCLYAISQSLGEPVVSYAILTVEKFLMSTIEALSFKGRSCINIFASTIDWTSFFANDAVLIVGIGESKG